jgi:hypothetical protein
LDEVLEKEAVTGNPGDFGKRGKPWGKMWVFIVFSGIL